MKPKKQIKQRLPTKKMKEIEQRRDTVIRMIEAGITYEQIAEKLGTGLSTIIRDANVRWDERTKRRNLEDAPKTLSQLELSTQNRIKELWTIVRNNKGQEKDRIRALEVLQKEWDRQMRIKQIAGKIPRDGPTIEVNQTNIRQENRIILIDPREVDIKKIKKGSIINAKSEDPTN